MTENKFAEKNIQCKAFAERKQKEIKGFQKVTLIALTIFWIGYGYAYFFGSSSNLSYYFLLILIFSILNINVIFGIEKMQNRVFNILAKLNGVLFFVWALLTIVSLILK